MLCRKRTLEEPELGSGLEVELEGGLTLVGRSAEARGEELEGCKGEEASAQYSATGRGERRIDKRFVGDEVTYAC